GTGYHGGVAIDPHFQIIVASAQIDAVGTDAVGVVVATDEHIVVAIASVDGANAVVLRGGGEIVDIAVDGQIVVAGTEAHVLQTGDVHLAPVMAFASDNSGVAVHVGAVTVVFADHQIVVTGTQVDDADTIFATADIEVVVTLGA